MAAANRCHARKKGGILRPATLSHPHTPCSRAMLAVTSTTVATIAAKRRSQEEASKEARPAAHEGATAHAATATAAKHTLAWRHACRMATKTPLSDATHRPNTLEGAALVASQLLHAAGVMVVCRWHLCQQNKQPPCHTSCHHASGSCVKVCPCLRALQ
jgi:hypothetical protein